MLTRKHTLGELKLSPIKENGKFVFINSEVRVNGRVTKGDYIKIYVDAYEVQNGQYKVKNIQVTSKIAVKGMAVQHDLSTTYSASVDELYYQVGTMYKNLFYFGRVDI